MWRSHGKGVASIAVSDEEDVLMVHEGEGSKEAWVLNSGCSHHVCGKKESFSSYEVWDGKSVTLLNVKEYKVAGIGNVMLELNNGQIRKLTSVRNVPRVDKNLISLGRLDKLGRIIRVKDWKDKNHKGEKVVLLGYKNEKNLFMLGKHGEEVRVRGETLLGQGRSPKKTHWRVGGIGLWLRGALFGIKLKSVVALHVNGVQGSRLECTRYEECPGISGLWNEAKKVCR